MPFCDRGCGRYLVSGIDGTCRCQRFRAAVAWDRAEIESQEGFEDYAMEVYATPDTFHDTAHENLKIVAEKAADAWDSQDYRELASNGQDAWCVVESGDGLMYLYRVTGRLEAAYDAELVERAKDADA